MKNLERIQREASARFKAREIEREKKRNAMSQPGMAMSVENADRMVKRLTLEGFGARVSENMVSDLKMPGNQTTYRTFLEGIVKGSELAPTAFLRKGARMAQAVGRILIKNKYGQTVGYGTGFLISPNMVMTNHHVLTDIESADMSVIEFDYEAENMYAPIRKTTIGFDAFKFFYNNEGLDFAIVALEDVDNEGKPLAPRPWIPLVRESGKALQGEPVNIVQHPDGRPQEVSVRENKIVDVIDEYVHYEADTQGGSSGSPVLSDQWILAALHHAGIFKVDDAGAIVRNAQGEIQYRANEGIRISSIVSHLDTLRWIEPYQSLVNGCFEPYVEPASVNEAYKGAISSLPKGGLGETYSNGGNAPANNGCCHITISSCCSQSTSDGSLVPPKNKLEPSNQPVNASDGSKAKPQMIWPTSVDGKSQFGGDSSSFDAQLTNAAKAIVANAQREAGDYYDAEKDEAAKSLYYEGINMQLSPVKLYNALKKHVRLTHTSPIATYRKARWDHLYPVVDLRPSGALHNIYSGEIISVEEAIRQELKIMANERPEILEAALARDFEAVHEIGTSVMESRLNTERLEGKVPFNCEHVVPQSWFAYQEPMKSDLHHLFTCDPGCNSSRSNHPYFDFTDYGQTHEIVRDKCGKHEGTPDGITGFEPEHGHGVVARATLYFLLRYPDIIGDESREMPADRLDVLLNWHKQFPVSEYELHRNATIFAAQGNRNPFIDFPNLAEKIDIKRGFSG